MRVNTHPAHLAIDNPVANRSDARRLSPNVAFRYHALPIGQEKDHITATMVNPNDVIDAIAGNPGVYRYVVQENRDTINQQPAQIWPGVVPQQTINILVYHQDSPNVKEVKRYAEYISSLISSRLTYFQSGQTNINFNDLVGAGCRQDLVIFGEPDQSPIKQILSGPAGCKAAEHIPASVLIVRQPRRPLKRVLLVTRGYDFDNTAVDWLLRLARPDPVKATVLALTPFLPTVFQHAATTLPHGLADWLASDTPLGHQLRRITQELTTWETRGRLRFRQGTPVEQVEQEVAEEDYDLVIIAADPDDWWQRRLLGEIVNPLLHRLEQPVLIAKPKT